MRRYDGFLGLALAVSLAGSAAHGADATQQQVDELRRKLDAVSEEVSRMKTGESASAAKGDGGGASGVPQGFAPSASKVYRVNQGVSIGGYGEFKYQRFARERDNGAASDTYDDWDALRAVLYTGYKFNDRFLFNSELEFEHATTSKTGSISVEFAYVDAFLTPAFNLRAGLLLVPMGIINELHEPTTFLGANRPLTETNLIPTTWRENGVGAFGDLGPVAYRSYVVAGFESTGFSSEGFRSGRQQGANSKANRMGWVTRADYVATPGLLAGASAYVGKVNTNAATGTTEVKNADSLLTIYEAHADWKWRGLELRALGAISNLSNVTDINTFGRTAPGLTGTSTVASHMFGYYLQAGYDVFPILDLPGALIPFVRYEKLNTQSRVAAGATENPARNRKVWTYGIDYKPIEQVVVKIDYQNHGNEAGTGLNQFDLALGYAF
jgi:hypothetical protein